MKVSLFLLFLGFAFVSSHIVPVSEEFNVKNGSQRIGTDLILEILEKVREIILNGDEEMGIPVLDPAKIPNLDFNINNEALIAQFQSSDLTLSGLGAFEINDISLNLLTMTLRFSGSFPLTKLTAEQYSLLAKVSFLPFYGDGKLDFEVHRFTFSGSARFSVGVSGVSVRSINLSLHLGAFKSQTTGMIGGGDIDNVINAILADFVPDLFNKNAQAIADALSEILLEQLNNILSGSSLFDFAYLLHRLQVKFF